MCYGNVNDAYIRVFCKPKFRGEDVVHLKTSPYGGVRSFCTINLATLTATFCAVVVIFPFFLKTKVVSIINNHPLTPNPKFRQK